MRHHVIDPAFFLDVISMYGTNYVAYLVSGVETNEYGMQKSKFEKIDVYGSLQTQGTRLTQKTSGNVVSNQFKFYCESVYRIRIGDFMVHGTNLLHVIDMQPYDEYGVRECTLEMTQLNEHQDLQEFVRFLTGDEIV